MIVELKHNGEAFLDGRTASSHVVREEESWRLLWKVKVPSKLRIFAWRLARSSLPTGETQAKRHMATTAVYLVCNSATDTWIHSLLDCQMAKSVWALKEDDVILPLYGDEIDDQNLWLFSLSSTLSSAKFIEVLITLWAIWWA
jgi:hypothetical protein